MQKSELAQGTIDVSLSLRLSSVSAFFSRVPYALRPTDGTLFKTPRKPKKIPHFDPPPSSSDHLLLLSPSATENIANHGAKDLSNRRA